MLRSIKKRLSITGGSGNSSGGSSHQRSGGNDGATGDSSGSEVAPPMRPLSTGKLPREYPPKAGSSNNNTRKSSSTPSLTDRWTSKAHSGGATVSTFRNRNSKTPVIRTTEDLAKLTEKLDSLSAFDACVEAADILAASSGRDTRYGGVWTQRSEHPTGLLDCSVLVSPDGDLLVIPQDLTELEKLFGISNPAHTSGTTTQGRTQGDVVQQEEAQQPPAEAAAVTRNGNLETAPALVKEPDDIMKSLLDQDDSEDTEHIETPTIPTTPCLSDLIVNRRDDYQSAVFLGNDLDMRGDRALNGFSAKGWSIPAASLALQQTERFLHDVTDFCENVILSKKDAAARTSQACDRLRSASAGLGDAMHDASTWQQDWEIVDPRATDFLMTPTRVGPLSAPGSSLHAAVMSLEQYYSTVADMEAERWRSASSQGVNDEGGPLFILHKAVHQVAERVSKRQQALEETSRRARIMEDHLAKLKRLSDQSWEAVVQAEAKVTQRVEDIMQERRRDRERQRLEQLREGQHKGEVAAGATSEEIWNMVSAVAESMDDGSFEPMLMPGASRDEPAVPASHSGAEDTGISTPSEKENSYPLQKVPTVSREQIEYEVGLPNLRQTALKADEDIEDAANALLGILSNLDIARRSARVAAETSLVSAGNAQAAALRSLVQLERTSLEERLKRLTEVEVALDNIHVREDLDRYITADKQDRGGSSHLGDDDDGGIASALAVLSGHVDGNMGQDPIASMATTITESQENRDVNELPVQEMISKAVDDLFHEYPALVAGNLSTPEAKSALADLQVSLDFLVKTALESSGPSKAKRSAICYTLNSKRSSNAEVLSEAQFDALCEVFAAILSGCDKEEGGVSNAKMCMMLAQTFYRLDASQTDSQADIENERPSSPFQHKRDNRIYVKSRLMNHPIWTKDDFWDEALSQQMSEALTHSGVMSNFDLGRKVIGRKIRQKSEWTQTRKTLWHDLTYLERIEAASQVQAVVFAQLGALAHSMIEFGCGLDRSCAFVRRMSIRNQLPSSQRTMLLHHLIGRSDAARLEADSINKLQKQQETTA